MTTPQAWRIYHNDAVSKTELTSSPTRVKKAREAGLTVVELIEVPDRWSFRMDGDWAYFTRKDGFMQAVTKNERQFSHAETLYQLISAIRSK